MKTTVLCILLAVLVPSLPAQVPVKKNLMEMLEKIPTPPASVKDAIAKVSVHAGDASGNCNAEQLFKSIERELQSVETEFAAQPKPGAGSAAPAISSDMAKTMNDPEMKKKMKKMSKEEKMQMAMEMMKSMQAGAPAAAIDPPNVRAALDAWQVIYNDTQNEFQRSTVEQLEETKREEEYQKAQSEVDAWESVEITKLPQISSGEMSAPDPVKVKELQRKSSEKHIAIANKRLEHICKQWRASVDHTKARYSAFYKKLVTANYAADSKNFSSKKILADAQMLIWTTIGTLAKQSRNAWEESASWQARRLNIEKK